MLPEALMESMGRLVSDGGVLMIPLVAAAAALWGAMGARAWLLWWGAPDDGGPPIVAGARRDLCARGRLTRSDVDAILAPHKARIQRHSLLIRSLVIVAPLGGLLGTVGGMIETFRSLEQMALFTQGGGVAGGIAQALLTTQMGLAVAIPGIVLGRVMDKKAQNIRSELAVMSEQMLQEKAA